MGNCSYCGKPAGLLKNTHKECEETFRRGERQLVAVITSDINQGKPLDSLEQALKNIAKDHFIRPSDIQKYLVQGWEEAVKAALEDNVLTQEEEHRLTAFANRFSLSQEQVDKNGAFTQLVHAGVLRDILNGKIPKRMEIEGRLPFNLQKDEQLIWVFKNVPYYEQKTRREYVGGSVGGSVRVAKGVYVRASSFRGNPVEKTETVHLDTGLLGVTNKHLYFAGDTTKSFRIPYSKIVSFKPYSDGIGIQRDASTAKPQSFLTGYGWFTYNLIYNLAKM